MLPTSRPKGKSLNRLLGMGMGLRKSNSPLKLLNAAKSVRSSTKSLSLTYGDEWGNFENNLKIFFELPRFKIYFLNLLYFKVKFDCPEILKILFFYI